MWGGDPSVAPYPFDLAKAAALLDEAGLKAKAKGAPRLAIELLRKRARGHALGPLDEPGGLELALVERLHSAIQIPGDAVEADSAQTGGCLYLFARLGYQHDWPVLI